MEINKDDFYRQDDFNDKYKYKEKDNEEIKDLKYQIRKLKYDIERYERQYPQLLTEYNSWLSEKYSMIDLIKMHPWPFKSIFAYTGEDSRILKEGKEFVNPKDYTIEQKNELVKEYRDDVLDEMKETMVDMKKQIEQLKRELELKLEEERVRDEIRKRKEKKEKEDAEKERKLSEEKRKKETIKKKAVAQIGNQLQFENDLFDLFSGKKKTKTSKTTSSKTTSSKTSSKTTSSKTKSIKSIIETSNKMEEWKKFLEGRKQNVMVKKEIHTVEEINQVHQMPVKRTKTETKVTIIDLTNDKPAEVVVERTYVTDGNPKEAKQEGPRIEELPDDYPLTTGNKNLTIAPIIQPPNIEEQESIGTLLIEGPTQQSSQNDLSLSLFDDYKKNYYLVPIDKNTGLELRELAIMIPNNETKILGRNNWPTLSNNYISREAIEVKTHNETFGVKALKQKFVTYQLSENTKIRNLRDEYVTLKHGDIITILKGVLIVKVIQM